jgi:hypothetical protein
MKRGLKAEIFGWVFAIIIVIIIVFFDKFIFETVSNSNLPDWIKWMLLH